MNSQHVKDISVETSRLEKLLEARVGRQLWSKIKGVSASDIPEIVYTSFDGDLLSLSEPLKQAVLKRNLVPLNPESALGTYLVVNHHKGNKIQIIEDCFALLTRCSHFWIMAEQPPRRGGDFFTTLSEGVLTEALYWRQEKNKEISILTPLNFEKIYVYDEVYGKIPTADLYDPAVVDLLSRRQGSLRPVFYLAAGERHAKHADWMRKAAYLHGGVPLCPYTLINEGTLTLSFDKDALGKILSRVALALAADDFWLFLPFHDVVNAWEKLDPDVLIELYLTKKIQPLKKVRGIYMGDADIPKYKNRQRWAMTALEQASEN